MNDVEKYWPPYLAGVLLGLVLLFAFFTAGRGLGASGAIMRATAGIVELISPSHAESNPYLAHYVKAGTPVMKNWLVFEVLGVIMGGFLSGALANRLKFTLERGPRISSRGRAILAFIGGGFMGYGARLGLGCTSGQALTGGATLAVGSWAFMLAVFAGGYLLAYFVRRQWI